MDFSKLMPLIGMAGGAALAPFTGGASMIPAMMGAGGMAGGAMGGLMGGTPPPPVAPPPIGMTATPKPPTAGQTAQQLQAQMMQRPKPQFGGGM